MNTSWIDLLPERFRRAGLEYCIFCPTEVFPARLVFAWHKVVRGKEYGSGTMIDLPDHLSFKLIDEILADIDVYKIAVQAIDDMLAVMDDVLTVRESEVYAEAVNIIKGIK